MLNLKSKFIGAAAAAALVAGFAPFALSADLWQQLEVTDGYTPTASPTPFEVQGSAAGVRAESYFEHERQISDGAAPGADHQAMKAQAARDGKVSEIRSEPGKDSGQFCLTWFEHQLRLTDGHPSTQC